MSLHRAAGVMQKLLYMLREKCFESYVVKAEHTWKVFHVYTAYCDATVAFSPFPNEIFSKI